MPASPVVKASGLCVFRDLISGSIPPSDGGFRVVSDDGVSLSDGDIIDNTKSQMTISTSTNNAVLVE